MASSELYETLKDKLRSVLGELRLLVKHHDVQHVSGEDLQHHNKSVQRLSSQAHALVKDLENEVYQAPMPYRPAMNREIKKFKYELDNIERTISQKHRPYYMGQATYGRGSSSQSPSPQAKELGGEQQSTIVLGHKSLIRASDSLARSNVISSENEVIGNNILNEIGEQGEQLLRTRDRLEDTNVNLTKSQKLIRSIKRNIIGNKLFLIFFIFLELVILGCVVYLKYFRK